MVALMVFVVAAVVPVALSSTLLAAANAESNWIAPLMTEPPELSPKMTVAIRRPEGKSALEVTGQLNTSVSPAAGALPPQFAPFDQLPLAVGQLHVWVTACPAPASSKASNKLPARSQK